MITIDSLRNAYARRFGRGGMVTKAQGGTNTGSFGIGLMPSGSQRVPGEGVMLPDDWEYPDTTSNSGIPKQINGFDIVTSNVGHFDPNNPPKKVSGRPVHVETDRNGKPVLVYGEKPAGTGAPATPSQGGQTPPTKMYPGTVNWWPDLPTEWDYDPFEEQSVEEGLDYIWDQIKNDPDSAVSKEWLKKLSTSDKFKDWVSAKNIFNYYDSAKARQSGGEEIRGVPNKRQWMTDYMKGLYRNSDDELWSGARAKSAENYPAGRPKITMPEEISDFDSSPYFDESLYVNEELPMPNMSDYVKPVQEEEIEEEDLTPFRQQLQRDETYRNMYNNATGKDLRQLRRGKKTWTESNEFGDTSTFGGGSRQENRELVHGIRQGRRRDNREARAQSQRNGGAMMRTFIDAMRRGGRL